MSGYWLCRECPSFKALTVLSENKTRGKQKRMKKGEKVAVTGLAFDSSNVGRTTKVDGIVEQMRRPG